MPLVFDALYLAALSLAVPWLYLFGKRRLSWRERLFGPPPLPHTAKPVAWFHGVSVGEIHLLRTLVAAFRRRHPDWQCVVTSTTDAGLSEAQHCFADLPICRRPLDFSWSVRRAFDAVHPNLIVLAESDLWPNFLREARRRSVPVAVVNGRMSPRSFHRFLRLRPLAGMLLKPVDVFAVQTEEYAQSLRQLGVQSERICATGSIKYDGVTTQHDNPKTVALRELFGISRGDLVFIAGSTQEPEEAIALDIFRRERERHPNLRLILVPRQPERFESVAELSRNSAMPFVRRSELCEPPPGRPAVILLDTIGELGAAWGLADIAFVGGSLDGKRGGQNMIEPAAYGAAVAFGPHVWNFRDTAERLSTAGGAVQVYDAQGLAVVVGRWLADAAERERFGAAARQFVLSQQGATERTMAVIDKLISPHRLAKAV
jgi:3-deoxy-D-manno-octulosonic-acid transferase